MIVGNDNHLSNNISGSDETSLMELLKRFLSTQTLILTRLDRLESQPDRAKLADKVLAVC